MSVIKAVTFNGGWITTREFLWVCHGQGASFVLSSLARVVWTTTIDVIRIFQVESVFETLGLIQIKLLLRLVGGSIQSVDIQSSIRNGIHISEATHNVHRVPLLAENLADLTGAHHLVGSRYLWSALAGEDHKGVHGTLRRPVRVKRLGDQRISEGRAILVVY